jgi:dTDP-4-amino-4,6-dideoxygalactose transaminase
MVDVVGQYKRIKPEIDAAIHRVLDSGQFILGKEVGEFEANAAKYLGVKHAVGCNSGTDALRVALMALGIGPGDEVITSPFTFAATAEAIVLVGATPVFVDIQPDTFNLNSLLIERAITKKTRAILPVHLFGQAADMDAIMGLARERKLHVVEDAAQAIGAEYKGKKVATIGDIGCISLFPSKNLGAYGDGGLIVTDDSRLADKMRMIIVHGSKVRYHHDMIGFTSRLDTLQAAVVNVKLKYLDEWNKLRQEAASTYDQLFDGLEIVRPIVKPHRTHVFHQYTIRARQRDELARHLLERKIPHAIYYPVPLHRQKALLPYIATSQTFRVTDEAAREVLSLPMHTELTREMQAYITDSIKEFYG